MELELGKRGVEKETLEVVALCEGHESWMVDAVSIDLYYLQGPSNLTSDLGEKIPEIFEGQVGGT